MLVEGMERAELIQLEDGLSYLEAEVDVIRAGGGKSSGYGKRSDASQHERTVRGILQRKPENESGTGASDTGDRRYCGTGRSYRDEYSTDLPAKTADPGIRIVE